MPGVSRGVGCPEMRRPTDTRGTAAPAGGSRTPGFATACWLALPLAVAAAAGLSPRRARQARQGRLSNQKRRRRAHYSAQQSKERGGRDEEEEREKILIKKITSCTRPAAFPPRSGAAKVYTLLARTAQGKPSHRARRPTKAQWYLRARTRTTP